MMPETSNGFPQKSSTPKRRNSDPLCYFSTDEEAEAGFARLYEETLQELLIKVRKESRTCGDLQGFFDHQQKYVGKLLDEIRRLQEEKQRMSLELFKTKMELDMLKKQNGQAYDPGYITGVVQELQKMGSTRSEVIGSYCDHVNSLAYQKSQQYVPYQNQVPFQPTFRPYQNGYHNYPPQFNNPYATVNPVPPPRAYGPYSVPSFVSECERPSLRGCYGMLSSSPLSSLSPASNSFGPSYPHISPQIKVQPEGRLGGVQMEALNPEMNGFRQYSDLAMQQAAHQVPAAQSLTNGHGWGSGPVAQPDPWSVPRKTESAPDQSASFEETRKKLEKDLAVSVKSHKQSEEKINELQFELQQLKKQLSQITVTKSSSHRSPMTSPQLRSAKQVEIDSPKFVCFPVAENDEAEDLKKAEHEVLVEFDRTLEHFSGGSSEEVFEESDRNSGSSGSPYLRSKPRNSPRCGVSSLVEAKSKDFPFNFIRSRETKLVRSQSDSDSGNYRPSTKTVNSFVRVIGQATEL